MLSLTPLTTHNRTAPTALVRRPDGRQFYLHSRVDPREEAAFLVADVPADPHALVIVAGFGLGYHVEALLARLPPSSRVLVIESAQARLSATAAPRGVDAAWRHDPRLDLLAPHDPGVAPIHIADRMTRAHLRSVRVVPHVGSLPTAPEFYDQLLALLPQQLPAALHQQLDLLDKMLEGDLHNFWANLSSSWNEAPVERLRGRWQGRPVVIVSGGPSLTAQLPLLASLRARALILATSSTVRTLLAHDIRPDLIVSVDPYDLNLAHFVGWDGAGIPLVYYHRFHSGIPRVYTGPMTVFRMRGEPPLPLLADESPAFSRGGTVAFSALQLAHLLGASPVVFVGQDFAFAAGRTHADGALYNERYDEAARPAHFVRVPAVHGGLVDTTPLMHAYLQHMQDYLLQPAMTAAGTRHVNTSPTGASIRGLIAQTLDQALGGSPELADDPRRLMRDALEPHTPPPPDAQRQQLDVWIDALERLLDGSEGLDAGAILDRVAGTALASAEGRGYADLRYVYDAKYRNGRHEASSLFASRLQHHFRQVLDTLRHDRGVLES